MSEFIQLSFYPSGGFMMGYCPRCGHIETGYEEDIQALLLLSLLTTITAVILAGLPAYMMLGWMSALTSTICFIANALAYLYSITAFILWAMLAWSIGSHLSRRWQISRIRNSSR